MQEVPDEVLPRPHDVGQVPQLSCDTHSARLCTLTYLLSRGDSFFIMDFIAPVLTRVVAIVILRVSIVWPRKSTVAFRSVLFFGARIGVVPFFACGSNRPTVMRMQSELTCRTVCDVRERIIVHVYPTH